jgi:hypothetical protein
MSNDGDVMRGGGGSPRQISFMVLSLTNWRSIMPIRSERCASASAIAAIVCRKVETFDPSDTMPPSTAAIDPRAYGLIGAEQAEHTTSSKYGAGGDGRLGRHDDLSASLGDLGELFEPGLDPCNLVGRVVVVHWICQV